MTAVIDAFTRQRDACADANSPFYATLLSSCIADLRDGGPVADVMAGMDERRIPPLLPLRFLGGVHRLVLSRRAPALALHYPSVGGDGDAHAGWSAFRSCIAANVDELRAALASPPQTNDVGRSALLLGALHLLVGRLDKPVRLYEIGSSAGLNLLADRFAVTDRNGDRVVGPPDALVVLHDAWHGDAPSAADVSIIESVGCDLSPVDVVTVEGRERLTSFVWPDDVERFERLRSALEEARRTPPRVERRDAVDFVRSIRLQPGTLTVLWHSVVTMYMDDAQRADLNDAIEVLRAATTAEAPFAHVWFEPRPQDHVRFVLRIQEGGDAAVQVVAESPPHGIPVDWWPAA